LPRRDDGGGGGRSSRAARALATIAAPWHFDGFPDEARAMLAGCGGAAAGRAALGVLPMEVLQSAFWSLDPARTVAKFEAFAALEAGSAEARAFVTLEDWANDGPPIPEAAAREMFEDLFGPTCPARALAVGGAETIDPAALACPSLNIVSTSDRIVPSDRDPRRRAARARLGHVGMVVGGRPAKPVGAARRLAFPHCGKLLGAAATSHLFGAEPVEGLPFLGPLEGRRRARRLSPNGASEGAFP
jgi:hypothetical protein